MAENLFLRVERVRCVQYCQVSLALLDRIDDETFPLLVEELCLFSLRNDNRCCEASPPSALFYGHSAGHQRLVGLSEASFKYFVFRFFLKYSTTYVHSVVRYIAL